MIGARGTRGAVKYHMNASPALGHEADHYQMIE
jgi:hypothetical protein